jgi:hypothetical protein
MDLLTGKPLLTGKQTSAEADLVLKLERNPIHIDRRARFSWRVILEVPDGGLLERTRLALTKLLPRGTNR